MSSFERMRLKMYCVILAIAILNLSAASEEQLNHHNEVENHNRNNHGASKRPVHNMTFIDKDENMLRMPALNKYFDEQKSMKKAKKSPKRTIQKIIKKNRGKLRKVYFSQVTKRSTIPPKVNYNEKIYGQDEFKKLKDETTTRDRSYNHNHKHKSNKVPRYHMPFQKLQKKKEDRRYKRGLSRELFILKDLDQIEFLSKENDNDVVNAHITNYLKV